MLLTVPAWGLLSTRVGRRCVCVLTAGIASGTFPSREMYRGSIVFGPASRSGEVALADHSVFICSALRRHKKILRRPVDYDGVRRFVPLPRFCAQMSAREADPKEHLRGKT